MGPIRLSAVSMLLVTKQTLWVIGDACSNKMDGWSFRICIIFKAWGRIKFTLAHALAPTWKLLLEIEGEFSIRAKPGIKSRDSEILNHPDPKQGPQKVGRRLSRFADSRGKEGTSKASGGPYFAPLASFSLFLRACKYGPFFGIWHITLKVQVSKYKVST